jgi:hypothetical protein
VFSGCPYRWASVGAETRGFAYSAVGPQLLLLLPLVGAADGILSFAPMCSSATCSRNAGTATAATGWLLGRKSRLWPENFRGTRTSHFPFHGFCQTISFSLSMIKLDTPSGDKVVALVFANRTLFPEAISRSLLPSSVPPHRTTGRTMKLSTDDVTDMGNPEARFGCVLEECA